MKNKRHRKRGNVTIVQTDEGLRDGQSKCPACGGTDIALNKATGSLRCNVCRNELVPEEYVKSVKDIRTLDATIVGSGATAILASSDDMLTFKCSSCGAEVIIDTSEYLQARCHWCRNTLSVNQQIPNGAVPDKVLPFCEKKEDAQGAINQFVRKRRFFAHPDFKKEFCPENVMGVYLPYMVVDLNAKASLSGQGEHLIRKFERGRTTYYEADVYHVNREFDLFIEDLTIETNIEKLKHGSSDRTNNIVNAIKPFDTENSVRWNAHFMRGFTSQKRDTNVRDLSGLIEVKSKDIARHQVAQTLDEYDRGVCWEEESLYVKGSQWKAAYLPIWLYSYKHKEVIHYVAANGRNLATMGSIPINWLRAWIFALFVQMFVTIPGLGIIRWAEYWEEYLIAIPFFLAWAVVLFYIHARYRNAAARFEHESEANAQMENLRGSDVLVERVETTRSEVEGRNDTDVNCSGQESCPVSEAA